MVNQESQCTYRLVCARVGSIQFEIQNMNSTDPIFIISMLLVCILLLLVDLENFTNFQSRKRTFSGFETIQICARVLGESPKPLNNAEYIIFGVLEEPQQQPTLSPRMCSYFTSFMDFYFLQKLVPFLHMHKRGNVCKSCANQDYMYIRLVICI